MTSVWAIALSTVLITSHATDAQEKFSVPQVVSMSNGLIPRLLQVYSSGRENLVVAPFGLATNLAMVMEGVDKNLSDEIAKALNLPPGGLIKQTLRNGFRDILEEFLRRQNFEESVGSYTRALVHSSLPLTPQYKNLLVNYYKANISQETPQKENEQVLELQSDNGVMSHWKDFHKLAVYTYLSHQSAASFTTGSGEKMFVPMIPQVGVFHFGYLPRLNSQAVELLLEATEGSLLLIMPDLGKSMSEVISKLSQEDIANIPKSLPLKECEVTLPQLAVITGDLDMGSFLKTLGLNGIFIPPSDKPKKKRGLVKFIKQNAYFATSFVAVNSVGASGIALQAKAPPKRAKRRTLPKMEINKPFLFFLMHRPTGLVLLSGVIQRPTQVPN